MDQTAFLRSLLAALDATGRGSIGRSELQASIGIDGRDLGRLLEEAAEMGFITGVEVAEVRGPVQAISLTPDGRRIASTLVEERDIYLGYRIASRPIATVGSSSGELFTVTRLGEGVLELRFEVTYTAAAEMGRAPGEIALEMGWSFVRGLLVLGDFESGESRTVTIASATDAGSHDLTSDDLERIILLALDEMLRAESRSSFTPFLDVEGVALVLGINSELVSETLIRLEVLGLVEPRAAVSGRPLRAGACRITRLGLERIATETSLSKSRQTTPTDESEPDEPGSPRTRVFVSYSHDSDAHDTEVLNLATRLRRMGVEVELDQYETNPAKGWLRWMTDMVDWADYVLVICTEAYRRRAMGREEPGQGLGATYEGTLISQAIFEAGGENRKFIPAVLDPDAVKHRPDWLRPYTYYDVSNLSRFEALYRHLTSQPAIDRPLLGELVTMRPVDHPAMEGAQPTEDAWHLDICFLWDSGDGRARYLTSWAPSTGFYTADDTAITLGGMGGVLSPTDLPIKSGISVGYLPGRSLHVDFSSPAAKVAGRLHTPEAIIEPHAAGGGAREYLSWNLERLPDLN